MIIATQQVRKMRGGAQSHLMLGSDRLAYVVKFQNNPQNLRVLANEFMATLLAQALGLTVPQAEIVEVPQWLIAGTKDLRMECERGPEPCKAGLQFGSRFVGGLLPGQTMDYLPEHHLGAVTNLSEFAGMLVMDKWMCNSDRRQAVFHKSLHEKRYMATFIDQGYCFDAANWTFADAPMRGVYARDLVYRDVKGWDSFEPWLSRVGRMDPQTAWNIARRVPPEWYGDRFDELEALIERLMTRRRRIRELIIDFRESPRKPFPQWIITHHKRASGGRGQVLAWTSGAIARTA